MATHEIALIAGGLVLAATLVTLMVHAVLWTGRDARKRGFQRVWLLQLLVVIEFPWPWLMYYFVTRNLLPSGGRGDRVQPALSQTS
jgi:hypothetical protein